MLTDEEVKQIVEDKIGKVYGFDPLTILTIISVVIAAVKLLNECRATKVVMKAAAKRGLAYKTFVNLTLIKPLVEKGLSQTTAEEIAEELRKEFLSRS